MHEFKHPKYYKELRKRNKSDQAISNAEATAASERATGPGQSLTRDSNADGGEGSRHKPQAPRSSKQRPQASSPKQQASSDKPQAASSVILEP